jgi:hypothetical protein
MQKVTEANHSRDLANCVTCRQLMRTYCTNLHTDASRARTLLRGKQETRDPLPILPCF